nr:DM13 domain-containing protein [Arthrobacter wenxiniae]
MSVGIVVLSVASGCTAPATGQFSSPATTAAGSESAATPATSRVLAGTFVSQGAPTRGEVRITESPGMLMLTLTGFSTGAGDDLYINFNPGLMTRNASGDDVVENPNTIQVVALRAHAGTQSYDLTQVLPGLPEVRSVTIYSNKLREAFGTANLR